MVLEPIAPPRVGQVLNLIGGLGAVTLTLLASTVTSVGGVVPMPVLAGLIAIGFLIRFAGTTLAIRDGRWGMSWGPRASSWILFGLAAGLLGLAGAVLSVVAFGAFVVVDAIGGFVKREETVKPLKPAKRMTVPWMGLGIAAYLVGVAAFHVLFASRFPIGILLTWTLLAFGFSLLILLYVRGAKGTENHLLPPVDHHRHERREERVVDPQRARAEQVLVAFRSRGDAGPFLELVREAAQAADLKLEDVHALESRILGSFARAGTGRDADIHNALDEVERLLALKTRTLETRP